MNAAQYMKRGRWIPVIKLGEGGQANVFLAVDKEKLSLSNWDCGALMYLSTEISIQGSSGERDAAEKRSMMVDFHDHSIAALAKLANSLSYGALKVLKPDAAWSKDPDPIRRAARLSNEIRVLEGIDHPHVIHLLDSDAEEGWLVTEFHRRGALDQNLSLFKNRPLEALRAFRDLIEGVAEIHRGKILHRDIRGANIFVADDGRLIVGDMGLVLEIEGQQTRLTNTGENVGAGFAMPPSLVNVKIGEFLPAFDVYCLGKVLWSMVSGLADTTLPISFSDKHASKHRDTVRGLAEVETIIEKCVVFDVEVDCLKDTGAHFK